MLTSLLQVARSSTAHPIDSLAPLNAYFRGGAWVPESVIEVFGFGVKKGCV